MFAEKYMYGQNATFIKRMINKTKLMQVKPITLVTLTQI